MSTFKLICFFLLSTLAVSAISAQRPRPVAVNIITDQKGDKLYVLELNSNNVVECYGDCERDWPEIRIEKNGMGKTYKGVQLSLNNKPVYQFDQESQNGNGKAKPEQENGDVWRITAPSR